MVYLVQEPTPRRDAASKSIFIDLTPAAKFGEFETLLPPGDIVLSTGPTLTRLRKGLSTFNDKDYLLLIGDPVAIGMATTVAAEMNHGRVRVLRWAKRERDYVVVSMNFGVVTK